MTEPDEATMPDTPEKAHGDALEELTGRRPVDGGQATETGEED
jgi:hypothetical protein